MSSISKGDLISFYSDKSAKPSKENKRDEKKVESIKVQKASVPTTTKKQPLVVKFQPPVFTKQERIEPATSSTKVNKKTPELNEELLNKKLDQKLRDLTTFHLEQLQTKSLQGVDRKKHLMEKLSELGLMEENPKTRYQRPRVPFKMLKGMMEASKKRAEKQKNIQKENNVLATSQEQKERKVQLKKSELVLTSSGHPLLPMLKKRQRKEKISSYQSTRDRGLKINTGVFKNGTLKLSKKEIEQFTKTK